MLMMTGLTAALCLLFGVVLDMAFGEVRKWHPLVGFGHLANRVEQGLNRASASRWTGAIAWLLVVLPFVSLTLLGLWFAHHYTTWLAPVLHGILLYFCLGLRSLRDHNLPIQQALLDGDLATAQRLTSYIVSRDTDDVDEEYLAKASVESVLENGCDAVFGTLFWFMVFGGAGAVLYRLANTLDAMWGYRSSRFLRFGCVAARIDDGLNWLPARLTALTYAILGNTRLALQCWQHQAPRWPSPNAGPVMAAGAGALHLTLGGNARYDGENENRPLLGKGKLAAALDIQRAWQLVFGGTLLWLGIIVLAALFLSGILYA